MKKLHLLSTVLMASMLSADILIEWSSDFDAANRQSDGATPLDESFEFLLGTFVGLTPDSSNLQEWEAAFQPFETAPYFPEFGSFSGSQNLENNAVPFETTARAYIWGRNGTSAGSEWILIGKPSWTWPNANVVGPPPLPVRWQVNTAIDEGDVVFGSVTETGGGGVFMTTGSVTFGLTYEAWAEQKLEPGELSLPDADFDGDGRSNFLEYALDSDPQSKDPPFQVSLTSGLEIEVPKVSGREVEWRLEGSDDLEEFATMTMGFEVVADDSERIIFRIIPPLGIRKFFRVKASSPG